MTTNDDQIPGALLNNLRVGILGLGLMGGSLALALRGHVAQLIAVERQAIVRQVALRQDIVDVAVEGLAGAPTFDLLVLATPVRSILDTLAHLPEIYSAGCAVIDLGSTKRDIVTAMNGLPPLFAALGGHPLCGKETAGLASADARLFVEQTFFLCRTRRTTPELEATALALIAAIGARPVFVDAAGHDTAVATVSHLPAVVSAALMRAAAGEHLWPMSASGFRDVSRLAGSDPRMMLDILLTNRDAILDALASYEAELAVVRRALEAQDEAALTEWLAAAQVSYAAYRRFKSAEHLLPSARPGESPPGKIA